VDPVILEQRGILIDRLEPEWDQCRAIFARKIGIERVELRLEFRPVIGRRAHTHDQHRDFPRLQLIQHCGKIAACLVRRNAAQQIVSAQLEDEKVGLFFLRVEREFEALQSGCAGIT